MNKEKYTKKTEVITESTLRKMIKEMIMEMAKSPEELAAAWEKRKARMAQLSKSVDDDFERRAKEIFGTEEPKKELNPWEEPMPDDFDGDEEEWKAEQEFHRKNAEWAEKNVN